MSSELPIRHHQTGEVVGHVPADMADGFVAIVRNGYAVGYYRATPSGREFPDFSYGHGNVARSLVEVDGTPDLIPMFEDGECVAMVQAP